MSHKSASTIIYLESLRILGVYASKIYLTFGVVLHPLVGYKHPQIVFFIASPMSNQIISKILSILSTIAKMILLAGSRICRYPANLFNHRIPPTIYLHCGALVLQILTFFYIHSTIKISALVLLG